MNRLVPVVMLIANIMSLLVALVALILERAIPDVFILALIMPSFIVSFISAGVAAMTAKVSRIMRVVLTLSLSAVIICVSTYCILWNVG